MALAQLNLLKRSEVGAALTALHHDKNLTDIEAAFNQLRALFLVAFNEDGTIKTGSLFPTPTLDDSVLTAHVVDGVVSYTWEARTVPYTVGTVELWPNATPKSGFLLCDGSLYAPSAYPELAAFLGSVFGGDGISTFGVPDFRGRSPVGVGTGTAVDATAWVLAAKRGAETHSLTPDQNGSHAHVTPFGTASDGGDYNSSGSNTNRVNKVSSSKLSTETSGTGAAHNNLQPSLGINFIIRAQA